MNFLLGFATLLSLVVAIRGGIQIEEDNGLLQDYVSIYFLNDLSVTALTTKRLFIGQVFP